MSVVWTQEADWEEGRPTDADALSPDWDHTVLEAVSEFDSEADSENDLNAVAAATKLGSAGFRVTFDSSTGAYGVIDATATNQTEGTINIWFNPTNFGLSDGKDMILVGFRDDGRGISNVWNITIRRSGTDYTIVFRYIDDSDAFQEVGTHTISGGDVYVHINMTFIAATGAGNNDGVIYAYVDDGGSISQYSLTNADNDTANWDKVRVGMGATNEGTFGNSFDFDEIRVSESVSPVWITEAAALAGSYGAAFTIEDTTARLIQFSNPSSETSITFEYKIDPNALTMGTNEEFINAVLDQAGTPTIAFTRMGFDGSDYYIHAGHRTDGNSFPTTADHTITDAQHTVRVVWIASSGMGNDDGELHLYIDGDLKESVTGIDNDTYSADVVRFGAEDQIDSGTSGVFFMDDMKWVDSAEHPPQGGQGITWFMFENARSKWDEIFKPRGYNEPILVPEAI